MENDAGCLAGRLINKFELKVEYSHNISSETEKSLVSAIVSRHCLLTVLRHSGP